MGKKIKDLTLVSSAGKDYKVPVSDLTSNAAQAVSLEQIAALSSVLLKLGNLSDLTTDVKTSFVAAINSANLSSGSTIPGFAKDVFDMLEGFKSVCEDPNIVRLSGRIVNVVSATTTAAVAYKGSGNGDTYRVVSTGSTALKAIVGVSVKCPAFAVDNNSIEQVMSVMFIPSTADFSLALVNASGATVETIPWVDGVAPVYTVGEVHVLTVSSLGVSVSRRITSNLFNE